MKISIISAIDNNNVMGNNGKIPWSFQEDFKYFKEKTMNHPIIMGRKTFQSIGKPLPNRLNIVLSSDETYNPHDDVLVVSSVKKALSLCIGADEVFICGGSKIYEEFMSLADNMYLTFIIGEFEGDTYFPEIKWGTDWILDKQYTIKAKDRISNREYPLTFAEINRV